MQDNVVSEGLGVNLAPGGGWTQLRVGGPSSHPSALG